MIYVAVLSIGSVVVPFLFILIRILVIEHAYRAIERSCPPPKSPPPPPNPMVKMRRDAMLQAQYDLEVEKARKVLREREQREVQR